MTTSQPVNQERRRRSRLPAIGPIVMEDRRVTVRQQDLMSHGSMGEASTSEDAADDSLEMATAQQLVRLKRGKLINNGV